MHITELKDACVRRMNHEFGRVESCLSTSEHARGRLTDLMHVINALPSPHRQHYITKFAQLCKLCRVVRALHVTKRCIMVPATVQDLKRMGISVLMKQLIRRHLFQTALVIAKVLRMDSVWIESIISMKKQSPLTFKYIDDFSLIPRSRAVSVKLFCLYGVNVSCPRDSPKGVRYETPLPQLLGLQNKHEKILNVYNQQKSHMQQTLLLLQAVSMNKMISVISRKMEELYKAGENCSRTYDLFVKSTTTYMNSARAFGSYSTLRDFVFKTITTSGVNSICHLGVASELNERQLMWLVATYYARRQQWTDASIAARSARPSAYFEPALELQSV